MKTPSDQLYVIFEQHLFNALVEDEGTEEFLNRVVQDYLRSLGQHTVIPHDLRKTVEDDLRDEVREMLRKKTYGHFSLKEFRQAQAEAQQAKVQAQTQSRSSRQAEPPKPKLKAAPSSAALLNSRLGLRRPRRSN